MATSYPGGLDDFAEITTQKQNQAVGGRDHRQMHNDLGDAVEAIQTELGTDPAGSSDTVKARIAAAETAISGKAASSHTHSQSDVTGLTAALADINDRTPLVVESGRESLAIIAATGKTKAVVFDEDFTLVPNVQCTVNSAPVGSAKVTARAENITKDGFNLHLASSDATSITGSAVVAWEAQQTTTEVMSPLDIPGLILHLDAQDNDSLVMNSGKVESWIDKAGGRVFTQATDANRPVLGTLNGKQAVQFDGVSQTLASSGAWSITRPFTMVVVGKLDTVPSAPATPFSIRPATNGFAPVRCGSVGDVQLAWKGSPLGGAATATTNAFIAVVKVDAENAQLVWNGAAQTAAAVSGEISGSSMFVGSLQANQFWPGEVSEIIALSGPADPTALTQLIDNYVKPHNNF